MIIYSPLFVFGCTTVQLQTSLLPYLNIFSIKWTIHWGPDLFKLFPREENQYLSALSTRLPQRWRKCLSSFQKKKPSDFPKEAELYEASQALQTYFGTEFFWQLKQIYEADFFFHCCLRVFPFCAENIFPTLKGSKICLCFVETNCYVFHNRENDILSY